MIKKILNLLATALLIITISSCGSTNIENNNTENSAPIINENAAKIKKHSNCMMWEIDGKDKNNMPAKIYVLGTIHVGDEKLYPVPDVIESAYDSADKIVGELSTDAWEAMSVATNKKKKDSEKRETERIKQTGKTLSDYLTENEKGFLLNYMKEDVINRFEPWFLSSELSDIPVTLSGLDPTQSYDIYFIEKSIKNEKYIEGLDTLETQLNDISYGDWNTQLAILKDTINDLINDYDSAGKHILDVYKTYLSADEKKLAQIINSNMKNDDSEYSNDYYNSLFVEKNKAWAEKIENYLSEGGTTFIFASCGHFVGDDSVFNFMAKDGILNY